MGLRPMPMHEDLRLLGFLDSEQTLLLGMKRMRGGEERVKGFSGGTGGPWKPSRIPCGSFDARAMRAGRYVGPV